MKLITARIQNQGEQGLILVAAISMLAILGVLFISLLGGSVEHKKWTDEKQRDARVDAVADTAIALAANEIWSGFEVAAGPNGMQPWNLRNYLDGLGIPDQAGAANVVPTDYLAISGLGQDADGNYPMGGGFILNLEVVREDDWDSSRVTIMAQASMTPTANPGQANNLSTAQQTFDIARPAWEGMDFALLANNVNCILCHANIDDADRYYNQDPLARGGFDRVRVGSLESIHIREDPESNVAGSIYLAGSALQDDGDPITDWANLSLKSDAFGADLKLVEDAFGGLTAEDLSPADSTTPLAGENLYLDYLANGTTGMVDGALPDYFPSPFPDNGGFDPGTGVATPELGDNRVLDSNEFMATAGSATGAITGGRVAVVPTGNQLADLASLDNALDLGPGALASLTSGNVVLHGTELNPIVLDGTVAIDGDVILSGVVKGTGSIMASGNVFIPGELKYADGTDSNSHRTYGVSSDGTNNALAVTAGGNITVGDPSHPGSGASVPTDGTDATPFNFIMDELAIFNRGEWIKTQPQLPGKAVNTLVNTETVQVPFQPTKVVMVDVATDVYEDQPTGNMIPKNVYGWKNYGTKPKDIYKTIHHPADPPAPYGSPWSESVFDKTIQVPDDRWEVVSTTMVPEMASTYVRTDMVPTPTTVNDGPSTMVDKVIETWEWITPMHPNPFYEGADFIPRYYAYDESTPVPIYNGEGYFDPGSEIWHAPERAENWTNGRLSVADPSDTSDPYLYDSSGNSIAVVQTVAPKAGWVDSDLLAQLVDRELSGRTSSDPVQVDATLYSGNSIFGMVPARGQAGVEGTMLVNGGLVAADIGVLAPKGIQINYDRRSREVLNVADERRLTMRRSLWAPAFRP